MKVKEISYSHNITLNLGNYESVRGQLGMTVTLDEGEDAGAVFAEVSGWVKNTLQAEMAQAYQNPPTEAIRAGTTPLTTALETAAAPEPPPPQPKGSGDSLKPIFDALGQAGRTPDELRLYLMAYYGLNGTKEIKDRATFETVLAWAGYVGSQEPIGDDLGQWLSKFSTDVITDNDLYSAFLEAQIGKQLFDPPSDWTWAEAGKLYVALMALREQLG